MALSTLFLTSCKKRYECCYYQTYGIKITGSIAFPCRQGKLRNNQVRDLEKDKQGNLYAAQWNDMYYRCELNQPSH